MLSSLSFSSMQQNFHVIPRPPPQVGRSGSEQQRPVAFGRRAASIRYPSEPPRLHLPVPFGRRGPSLYPIGEPNRPLQNSFDTFRPRVPHPATWSQSSYPKQNPSGLPSPIQRIPVEILGEIFASFLQEPQTGLYFDPFSSSLRSMKYSNTSPIILGHICHYWRQICLLMPTLWSSIAVHIPRASHIPVIQLWLDRAANCPLALMLSQSTSPVLAELEATNQILSLFLTRAHLWRHIKFKFSHGLGQGAPLLNLPETPFLESVHVDMPAGDRDPGSIDKFWRHIHSLPTLRKVDWGRLSCFRELRNDVPWGQLTLIDMPRINGSAELEQLLGTLQQCQELIQLECEINMLMEPSIPALFVTLPKLRRLKITFRGQIDPAPFMKHLTFPSLTSLDISQCFTSSNPRLMHWLDGLLDRSACQLKELYLTDGQLGEDEFLRFLSSRGAQHLVNFKMFLRKFTDRTAEALTFNHETKAVLLPNLQALQLPKCYTSNGSVFKMVSSRLPVLKTARIFDSPSVRAFDLPALQRLVSAGSDLHMTVISILDGKIVEWRLR